MNEIIFSQLTAILWMVILIFSMTHPQDFPRSWNSHEIITVAEKEKKQPKNKQTCFWFIGLFVSIHQLKGGNSWLNTKKPLPQLFAVFRNAIMGLKCSFKNLLYTTHSIFFIRLENFTNLHPTMTSLQEGTAIFLGIYFQQTMMHLFAPMGNNLDSYEIIYQ